MSSGIQRKLHSGIDLRQKKRDKLISELPSSIFSASLHDESGQLLTLFVYISEHLSCQHYFKQTDLLSHRERRISFYNVYSFAYHAILYKNLHPYSCQA